MPSLPWEGKGTGWSVDHTMEDVKQWNQEDKNAYLFDQLTVLGTQNPNDQVKQGPHSKPPLHPPPPGMGKKGGARRGKGSGSGGDSNEGVMYQRTMEQKGIRAAKDAKGSGKGSSRYKGSGKGTRVRM